MITDNKFAEVMGALMEIYDGGPKSIEAMKLYKLIMDRNFRTDKEFENAAFKLLEERVYPTFPKPAEFIQIVKPKKEEIDSRVVIAAIEIKNAIRKYGANSSIAFEDYVIHLIIKYGIGSWVKLCKMTEGELEKFLKWDFPKLYREYFERKGIEVPLYLEGYLEHKNSQLGYDIPKAVTVGDNKKIKKWQDAYVSKNALIAPKNKLKSLGYKMPASIAITDELIQKMTPEEVFAMHR